VVGPHYEFAQLELSLSAIFVEQANEKLDCAVGLKKVALAGDKRRNEACAYGCDDVPCACVSDENGHERRLKPVFFFAFAAR
jgi:hypothetical protein